MLLLDIAISCKGPFQQRCNDFYAMPVAAVLPTALSGAPPLFKDDFAEDAASSCCFLWNELGWTPDYVHYIHALFRKYSDAATAALHEEDGPHEGYTLSTSSGGLDTASTTVPSPQHQPTVELDSGSPCSAGAALSRDTVQQRVSGRILDLFYLHFGLLTVSDGNEDVRTQLTDFATACFGQPTMIGPLTFLRFCALCDVGTPHDIFRSVGKTRLKAIFCRYDRGLKGYLHRDDLRLLVEDIRGFQRRGSAMSHVDIDFIVDTCFRLKCAFSTGNERLPFRLFVEAVRRSIIQGTSRLLRVAIFPKSHQMSLPYTLPQRRPLPPAPRVSQIPIRWPPPLSSLASQVVTTARVHHHQPGFVRGMYPAALESIGGCPRFDGLSGGRATKTAAGYLCPTARHHPRGIAEDHVGCSDWRNRSVRPVEIPKPKAERDNGPMPSIRPPCLGRPNSPPPAIVVRAGAQTTAASLLRIWVAIQRAWMAWESGEDDRRPEMGHRYIWGSRCPGPLPPVTLELTHQVQTWFGIYELVCGALNFPFPLMSSPMASPISASASIDASSGKDHPPLAYVIDMLAGSISDVICTRCLAQRLQYERGQLRCTKTQVLTVLWYLVMRQLDKAEDPRGAAAALPADDVWKTRAEMLGQKLLETASQEETDQATVVSLCCQHLGTSIQQVIFLKCLADASTQSTGARLEFSASKCS